MFMCMTLHVCVYIYIYIYKRSRNLKWNSLGFCHVGLFIEAFISTKFTFIPNYYFMEYAYGINEYTNYL